MFPRFRPLLFLCVALLGGWLLPAGAVELALSPGHVMHDFRPGSAAAQAAQVQLTGGSVDRFRRELALPVGASVEYSLALPVGAGQGRIELELTGNALVSLKVGGGAWVDLSAAAAATAVPVGLGDHKLWVLDPTTPLEGDVHVRVQAVNAVRMFRLVARSAVGAVSSYTPGQTAESTLLFSQSLATLSGATRILADKGNLIYRLPKASLSTSGLLQIQLQGQAQFTYSFDNTFYYLLTGITSQTSGTWTIYQVPLSALASQTSNYLYLKIADTPQNDGTGPTFGGLSLSETPAWRDGDLVSVFYKAGTLPAYLTTDFSGIDSRYSVGTEHAVEVAPYRWRIDYVISDTNNLPNVENATVAVRDSGLALGGVNVTLRNAAVDWLDAVPGVMSQGDPFLFTSLMGLVNRDGPRILLDEAPYITNPDMTDDDWLADLVHSGGYAAQSAPADRYTLLDKYAASYTGAAIFESGSYFDLGNAAGSRECYASLEMGSPIEAPHLWYSSNTGLGGGTVGFSPVYRVANSGGAWVYEFDLPDNATAAVMHVFVSEAGRILATGPAGVSSANHATFSGSEVLTFSDASYADYRIDLTSLLAGNPQKKLYLRFEDTSPSAAMILHRIELDNGLQDNADQFLANVATTMAGAYDKLLCHMPLFNDLAAQGRLAGSRFTTRALAEFEPGSSAETPHVWYAGASSAGGGTPGVDDNVFRAAPPSGYWIYEFDLPDDLESAMLRLSLHQNGIISVATPAGVNTTDHSAFTGTQVLTYQNASFIARAIDLAPFLVNNPTKKLYVKFESYGAAVPNGILLFHLKLDSGFPTINPDYHMLDTSDESFIEQASGLGFNPGFVYTDAASTLVYRMQVPAAVTRAQLRVEVSNQYKVELASSASGPWQVVAQEAQDVRDASNRRRLYLDLQPYLASGTCFVRFSDARPADGWGTSLYEAIVLPHPSQVDNYDLTGLWSEPLEAYRWAYDTMGRDCGDELIATHEARLWAMRDLTVMRGGYTFYFDFTQPLYDNFEPFVETVYTDKSVLDCQYEIGWARPESTEGQGKGNIAYLSEGGMFMAAGESMPHNLSFYSRLQRLHPEDFSQSIAQPITPDPTKTYITFLMSDGDNLHVHYSRMRNWWGDAQHGAFPLGWGIPAFALELAPGFLEYYYRTRSAGDYLHPSPSGIGYAYLSSMTSTQRTNFQAQAAALLPRLGARFSWVLDWQSYPAGVLSQYCAQTGIDALFVNFGGDGAISVDAASQTPLINSINTYELDRDVVLQRIRDRGDALRGANVKPGYIFVTANQWGMSPTNLKYVVDQLGSDYVVLRPDQFVATIRQANGLPTATPTPLPTPTPAPWPRSGTARSWFAAE